MSTPSGQQAAGGRRLASFGRPAHKTSSSQKPARQGGQDPRGALPDGRASDTGSYQPSSPETNSNPIVPVSVLGTELAIKVSIAQTSEPQNNGGFSNEKIVFDCRINDRVRPCRSGSQRLCAGQFRRCLVAGQSEEPGP